MSCDCEKGMTTTETLAKPGRLKRQVGRAGNGMAMLEEGPMPIAKYDVQFGGKPGSASKAMASMQRQYGPKKGTSVFYATKNKRKGGGTAMAAMQRR